MTIANNQEIAQREADHAQRILSAFKQRYGPIDGLYCSGVSKHDCYTVQKANLSLEVDSTGGIREAVLWKDPRGFELKPEYAKPSLTPVTPRTQRLEIKIEDAVKLIGVSLDGDVTSR